MNSLQFWYCLCTIYTRADYHGKNLISIIGTKRERRGGEVSLQHIPGYIDHFDVTLVNTPDDYVVLIFIQLANWNSVRFGDDGQQAYLADVKLSSRLLP